MQNKTESNDCPWLSKHREVALPATIQYTPLGCLNLISSRSSKLNKNIIGADSVLILYTGADSATNTIYS